MTTILMKKKEKSGVAISDTMGGGGPAALCRAKADAKPRVSLTVPNCNHFAQVSLTVLDIFWMQAPKLKKLIRESIASFTDKEFFSFGNGV